MWNTIFKLFITITAIIIAIIHLVSPGLSIDSITLTLLLIAIAPWLGLIFKSLEFPGGVKIEYHDLQKAKKDAESAGLLSIAKKGVAKKYSYQLVLSEDPNLALAGLRIEIERRLNNLAEVNNIRPRRLGVGGLLMELRDKKILTPQESSTLSDMVTTLNSAVHGAKVDKQASEWVIDVGTQLLTTLDEKSKK